MKYLTIFLPILLLFSTSDASLDSAASSWKLVKEKGTIKVYTRKSDDADIKELRITTIMNAPLGNFIQALNDADSYKDWVYHCLSSKLVERVSDRELYYHVKTDFPFPLSDRDLVVHTKQKFDETGIFYSDSYATPDKRPEEKGVVRILVFETHWKVTLLDDGRIKMEYHSKVDPAGQIPVWVVNMGLTVGPLKSIESFTKFVEEWSLNN